MEVIVYFNYVAKLNVDHPNLVCAFSVLIFIHVAIVNDILTNIQF